MQLRLDRRGIKVTIVDKTIGYELRCADPIPFDAEYTRDLGYGAVKFLLSPEAVLFGAIIRMSGGELQPLVEAYERYLRVQRQIREDKEALSDPELREMALEELPGLEQELEQVDREISVLLLPTDPNDERDVIVEIRAGAGGDEAGLFAADLFRMYTRYAEDKRWRTEILSANETGMSHEAIGRPSTSTKQAPHWPLPQPKRLPTRPSSLRRT